MATTTVGTIELIAKIDTGNYKKGAKEIDDANKQMESSTSNTDSKLVSLGKKGFKVAAVGALGLATAIGAMTVKGGISRALNIEDAQAKLRGLGHDADSVKDIMNSALASVKGTAYGLDAAATLAATAVAAGVKPGQELTKYLSLAADAATIAGTSIDEMGSIFGKVQTQQRAYTQELNMLADRGIPIYQWLQDELGLTQEQLRKMVAAGEVDSATYFKVIQKNIGGAALESGKTTRGAYQNLLAALSRIGQRIVQGPIDKIRTGFGDMTRWIDNNADTIVSTVQGAMRVVSTAVTTTAGVLRTLSPIIAAGAAAWVAYRAAVIAVNAVQQIQAMYAAATATKYMVLNGSLIAVRTATISQTIAQKALNVVMAANPIGLVTAALGGMVAALVVSNLTTDRAETSTSRLTAARQAAKTATDALKESEDALTGAQLNAEGAALAVERAQLAYNDAVAQYGPKSLQAREAAYNLKRAEDELKKANQEVTKATDDKLKKEKEVADARNEVAKAEEEKRKQFSMTTMQINTQKTALERLREQLQKDYTPTQAQKNSQTLRNNLNKSTQPKTFTQKYLGGSVSAGMAYLVGENRDGSINDTTELFVPNTSGRIINSRDLQEALSNDDKGDAGVTNNIQTLIIEKDADIDLIAQKLGIKQLRYHRGIV